MYVRFSWVGTHRSMVSASGLVDDARFIANGDAVLRVKGISTSEGTAGPVAIHGVQHIVHSAVHLRSCGGTPAFRVLFLSFQTCRRSRIRESFEVFLRLAIVAG